MRRWVSLKLIILAFILNAGAFYGISLIFQRTQSRGDANAKETPARDGNANPSFLLANTSKEILARIHTPRWIFSLERSGGSYTNECTLELVAEQNDRTLRTSLRASKSHRCMLFGTTQIVASSSPDFQESLVIVEAARGGDGFHTGPILQIFRLKNGHVLKIGEQELFDAIYQRVNGEIKKISGKVLFDLCLFCDGPAMVPEDAIFVPVDIGFEGNSIKVIPSINKQERKRILNRFLIRKERALAKNIYEDHAAYFGTLEKRLRELLSK